MKGSVVAEMSYFFLPIFQGSVSFVSIKLEALKLQVKLSNIFITHSMFQNLLLSCRVL